MRGLLADQKEACEERCESFTSLAVWPGVTTLNWRGWLGNFPASELRYARCLLEAFCYFGRPQTDALLRAAFHSISREVTRGSSSGSAADLQWRRFLDSVIVTFVEGENPSPTDSGYYFARRARDLLGVPESRVVFPGVALQRVHADPTTPIVFVDDLVGSGQQFSKTWKRILQPVNSSFAAIGAANAWYVPLIATWKGVNTVALDAPSVRLRPAHVVAKEYSAKTQESLIWAVGDHQSGRDFVEAASARAGYPGAAAWGFHELGLTLAVDDTIPDFSLPLLFSTRNDWVPLMRRSTQ